LLGIIEDMPCPFVLFPHKVEITQCGKNM